MKKFIRYIAVIVFVPILLFGVANLVYFKISLHTGLVGPEVYEAIATSGQKTDYTILVLGDSVARQFFNPDNQAETEKVCYLATNQAIMVAGNDILLERFTENNPQTEKVYYIVRPDSLMSRPNYIYTYSYFITPFFSEPFLKYLYPDTVEELEGVYGTLWSQYEFSKWFLGKYPKALELYYKNRVFLWNIRHAVKREKAVPDLSLTYLRKMLKVCDDNSMELHLIASPLPEGFSCDLDVLQSEMENFGLLELFEEYVASMQYVDTDEFIDGIHLSMEYVEAQRVGFINSVLEGE